MAVEFRYHPLLGEKYGVSDDGKSFFMPVYLAHYRANSGALSPHIIRSTYVVQYNGRSGGHYSAHCDSVCYFSGVLGEEAMLRRLEYLVNSHMEVV